MRTGTPEDFGQPVPAGTWVQVHRVLLVPGERAPGLPADTAGRPYEGWVKGFLVQEAGVGENATVRTPAGRLYSGRLVSVLPPYEHSFGPPVPALSAIGPALRQLLEGEG